MRVLVTGARGKVGRATVAALTDAGHEVVGTDLVRPAFEIAGDRTAPYVQADLCDAGDAYAVVRGFEAVVHCAAIPDPYRNVPHAIFSNNLLSTFNLAEAAVSFGIRRLVNISSVAVAGYGSANPQPLPPYLPTDEQAPAYPQDAYALTKHFGEQLMDAVVRRSAVCCISLRPSWAQGPNDYAANLGPGIRDPQPRLSRWSYVDVGDLADAIVLAVGSDLPGHEVFHIAAEDNATGWPLEELVGRFFPDRVRVRPLPRPDASPVSSDKARRLLGFRPARSWRDHLDADGAPHTADPAGQPTVS